MGADHSDLGVERVADSGMPPDEESRRARKNHGDAHSGRKPHLSTNFGSHEEHEGVRLSSGGDRSGATVGDCETTEFRSGDIVSRGNWRVSEEAL